MMFPVFSGENIFQQDYLMPDPIHTNSWQVSLFEKAMALIDFETADQMTMVSGKSDHCCNAREMLQVPNMLNISWNQTSRGYPCLLS
jgi:hypothetical protein